MKQFINRKLDAVTMSRVSEVMVKLAGEFGDDFKGLSWDRRCSMAIQVMNSQRTSLNKGKLVIDMFTHIIPWIVALLALLK